ncbi:ubiquitin carboxyl-terminal hydrolase 4/11/15 [Talaromyces islandicus]|uniref:Ubiquitin carboxyl-terminal hydrolase 4/11/15 n=1 Tax=Talaromyces islandicus TaxID=28573 RepID=A0A0U1LK54_TALIS|nr:ubiquitin carboxyl-terminal hydrolase 4/11/15 [Talaromyces islandicus]
MWNDEEEDNNPYGAFDRPNSHLAESLHSGATSPPCVPRGEAPYDRDLSPASRVSSQPPDYASRITEDTDEDEDDDYGVPAAPVMGRKKKGGYDSRIEQILYENPELPILITDAGKNHEGGGGYIVYTIRTGDLEVRRRYSEFASLRQTLVNLHPTLVVPPIPEKHTMADYAAKPTKAKEDVAIIELRKRMLSVFLNRCRKMKEVREDGVWWRFLDPNVSWNEVLHSHPASSVPKNNLKAPPLDPANPTPAHGWLPVPSASAKLKSASGNTATGTPSSPSEYTQTPSTAAHSTPGVQVLGRFPPTSRTLSEQDLDPYFINFEASTRELELLLQGNIEKVNRRTLSHLSSLSADLMELGARYNGFSLSEQNPTVAAAVERIGQAADTTYIETEELSSSLGANFAEPMRESAQFASVVRSVLRYRVLKRVQEDMTREELSRKQSLLESLERSEQEAKRIDQYLSNSANPASVATRPSRSTSASSAASSSQGDTDTGRGSEDTTSVDSDFPPTHGDASWQASAGQREAIPPPPAPVHRKSSSGNFVANRIFGRISHAVHGFVDVDPERSRRDQIGKTKESLVQLEQALGVSEKDVKDASAGVLQDLKRFQKEKEEDLRRYMVAYARCHLDWARKNLTTWTEARDEVDKISFAEGKREDTAHPESLIIALAWISPRLASIASSARAATRRGQLTFTTSSSKRRRVVEHSPAPAPAPAADKDRHRERRHRRRRPSATASHDNFNLNTTTSKTVTKTSPSPSPRYIPAHLQDEVLGAAGSRSAPKARSPTPETAAASPSAACAGLSLNSDPPTDMSGSEKSDVRSSSPAVKRRMSEVDQAADDVDMDSGPSDQQQQHHQQEPEGVSRPSQRRATSVDMIASEGDANTTAVAAAASPNNSDPVYPTPSSMATYANSSSTKDAPAPDKHAELPSIDEQVMRVLELAQKFPEDKQKGYVLSYNWLNRVLARSTQEPGSKPVDKKFAEGDIGPVDNSDLVLDVDPTSVFEDEAGEPYVPLRPGLQMGDDFEIVPQAAWDLILTWYGRAEQSPAIVRYAHNTSDGDSQNIQYEISPPIYTIHKLPGSSAGFSHHTLRDKSAPPVKFLASRQTNFQKWLTKAKQLAHIDMATKVRVWRVLDGLSSTQTSGFITPVHSRSNSPAPGATLVANAGNSLVLDVNTFASLSDTHRELIEEAKDQTSNDKYNGKSTLDTFGLGDNAVLVLEEQIGGPGGGEWVSDASKSTLNRLSIPSVNKTAAKVKSKALTTSGRTTPTEPIRGRKKDGRPKGNTGFTNLGNTCYMASALQCVRSVEELSYYFLNNYHKKDLNPSNPLAHNGDVAKAYANLLRAVYEEGPASFSPKQFKNTIGRYGPAFSGYGQQDSQEFLLFLLDGLHEDLNRIMKKPYIEKPDSTDEMVHDPAALKDFADKCWDIYKARNDSVVTDLFAGMYKSTLVCPSCDKVSIIFDPFNNLTLQLPVENLWTKDIFYFPLHKPPVLLDIEIDKNASIKALKELVASKTGADPQKLIMAEIYKQKFYKLFDNASTIADSNINPSDDIAIFEVEMVPTNYNPDRPKKTSYYTSFSHMDHEDIPEIDSPRAEKLLVPVFNRVHRPNTRLGSRQTFGAPSFVVITREEALDYDTILLKVLQDVATLTTRDFLNEAGGEDESTHGDGTDSDAVIMDADDADSDAKVKAASVQSEDGLVDVSMEDAAPNATRSTTRKTLPSRFRHLFEMKVVKSKNEVIPLGFSSVDDNSNYMLMSSRIPKEKPKPVNVRKATKQNAFKNSPDSPVSSDDEINTIPASRTKRHSRTSSSSGESPRFLATADSSEDEIQAVPQATPEEVEVPKVSYIRPGEGIVLDWKETSYEGMFGADPKSRDELRGAPTWTNVEHLPDEDLAKRRAQRASRRKKGLTLDQCLDEFGREEILSENDAWYCPRCKEHRRASKKFELWKAPDILVIHLKRFSASRGFRDKIDELVDFPIEGLDLNGRIASAAPDESLVYDLFAVDNHYGGLGGGHYTAYAKNFLTDEWNEYNDSHVSKAINPAKAVSTAAYLLFYRRRSEHPLGGKELQEITESSVRADSDEQEQDSRAGSPLGEGRRLVDSSRNGSTSALGGVAAAHQAGDGGLRAGPRVKSVEVEASDEDELPAYEQRMDIEPSSPAGGFPHDPPAWSFDRLSEGENHNIDFDDSDSNKAVGGGDMGDMSDLEQFVEGDNGAAAKFHSVTADEDEDLPVVELRVGDAND